MFPELFPDFLSLLASICVDGEGVTVVEATEGDGEGVGEGVTEADTAAAGEGETEEDMLGEEDGDVEGEGETALSWRPRAPEAK